MRYCPNRGLSKLLLVFTPVVILIAGCTDGTVMDPTGDDLSRTEAALSETPKGRMELAFAQYQQDMTAENLAALRKAKGAYGKALFEQSERDRKKSYVPVNARANAAVDQGWTGGTTEWTYAWQGQQAIPDPGVTLVTQTVPGHGTILDADIEITELRHTWVQDLLIRLLSPAGASVELAYGNPQVWDVQGFPGGVVDYVGTYFDDEATVNISAWDNGAHAPFTGSFKPYGQYTNGVQSPSRAPLSLVDGQDMMGTWSLRVEDYGNGDTGEVRAWRLILTLQGAPLPGGGVGLPYSATPTGMGTDGTYAWSVTSGSLPAGLTLDASTGRISGTPTATGTSSFTVLGVQGGGGATTATAPMSITINAALQAAAPGTLAAGVVGSPYPATQLTATGGGGGYVWSGQGLPAGMTLSAAGVLGGTPSAAGTYNVTANVTSSDGQTASVGLSLTVIFSPLVITTPTTVYAVAGVPFALTLQAMGGGGGYVWTLPSGTLPDGLTFTNGVISGTPQGAVVRTVTVGVSSADGSAATTQITLQVTDPNEPVSIVTSGTLPGGIRSQPYSTSLVASGADRVFTWSLPGGSALPGGLTLATDGTISGTPTLAGLYTFDATVQAGYGAPVTGTFTLEVVNPPVVINTVSLPGGVWNAPYATTLQAAGGAGTYDWTVVAGSLPPGVTLSGGGVFSGTPTDPGTFTFTLRATSGVGDYVRTADGEFTVQVTYPPLVITNPGLPFGGTGASYTPTQLTATGGNNQYTWSIVSGSLPPGLTMADGLISGLPTIGGLYPLTVKVESGVPGFTVSTTKGLSITIVLDVPETLEDCANGGYADFRFETEAQCVRFVETGMDSRAGEFPPLTILDTSVPGGVTGTPYSFTFTATGGADNLDSYIEWTESGTPGWLALDSGTGTIAGTPLIAGAYPFAVRATTYTDDQREWKDLDVVLTVTWGNTPSPNVCAGGVWAEYNFNNEAQCRRFVSTGMDSRLGEFPDPTVTTASLPGGRPGVAYSTTLTAEGGADNVDSYYTWAVAGLPSWLTLDAATGILSGTPTLDGTYSLSVVVTSTDPSTGYVQASIARVLSLRVSTDPTSVAECKKGGWQQFGFRNQGQCIAFVNTGRDSR